MTQAKIDVGTTAVLTAIYKLAPYFDLTVTALNGTCAATVGDQTGGCGGYKPLKGADVTLVALPYDGYTFVGWYDKLDQRHRYPHHGGMGGNGQSGRSAAGGALSLRLHRHRLGL